MFNASLSDIKSKWLPLSEGTQILWPYWSSHFSYHSPSYLLKMWVQTSMTKVNSFRFEVWEMENYWLNSPSEYELFQPSRGKMGARDPLSGWLLSELEFSLYSCLSDNSKHDRIIIFIVQTLMIQVWQDFETFMI